MPNELKLWVCIVVVWLFVKYLGKGRRVTTARMILTEIQEVTGKVSCKKRKYMRAMRPVIKQE